MKDEIKIIYDSSYLHHEMSVSYTPEMKRPFFLYCTLEGDNLQKKFTYIRLTPAKAKRLADWIYGQLDELWSVYNYDYHDDLVLSVGYLLETIRMKNICVDWYGYHKMVLNVRY